MRILTITPKQVYATSRFIKEAARLGIDVVCSDVASLEARRWQVDTNAFDALYIRQAHPYYDEVFILAKQFYAAGKVVVDNNIASMGVMDNKLATLEQLRSAELRIPHTQALNAFLSQHELKYPFVIKWIYGSGGRHVYLVESGRRFEEIIRTYPLDELIYQEYIEVEYEYSVIAVGYKSLPLVVKYKIHPVKKVADLKNLEIVQSSLVPEIVNFAERGSKILGRELAKSDIIERAGVPYLLEVNRQPGLKPFEEATGLNVASMFLEYIISRVQGLRN